MAGTLYDEIIRATGGPTINEGLMRFYADRMAPGANLITNPTFDVDLTGWTIQSGTAVWAAPGVARPTRSGGALGRLRQQIIGFKQGALHRVTVDRILGTTVGGGVSISPSATSTANAIANNVGGTGQVSMNFIPTTSSIWLHLDSGAGINGQYTDYDNVVVQLVGSGETTVPGMERAWLLQQTGAPASYTNNDMWMTFPPVGGTILDKKLVFWSGQ
jgi:hypothetical protein